MQPSMTPAWLIFFPVGFDGIGTLCVPEAPVPGAVALAGGFAAAVGPAVVSAVAAAGALVPGCTTAPLKVTVLKWHLLHAASVGGWVADFPSADLLL
jgi:hypothetical protein